MSNDTDITMPGTGAPDREPPRPRYRRKRYVIPLGIVGGIATLLVGVAIGAAGKTPAAVGTAHQSPAPAPTVTVTETATQQARPQPTITKTKIEYRTGTPGSGGTTVTSRFNGTGTQNTGTFTVPDNWHLSWSYWGCPSSPSNFQVDEYNSDGSMDFNGVSVNELGSGRGPVATYAYGDGGTHYFSINTEGCSWSLAIVTG
jgi:hypothetical protein